MSLSISAEEITRFPKLFPASVGENLTYKFIIEDGLIVRELKKFVLSLETSKSSATSIKISEFKLLEVSVINLDSDFKLTIVSSKDKELLLEVRLGIKFSGSVEGDSLLEPHAKNNKQDINCTIFFIFNFLFFFSFLITLQC